MGTMSSNRQEVSFARALADSKVRHLLWPEGTVALLIGVGGGIGLLNSTSVTQRVQLVGDSLQLVATLLGVSFAAFALMIALLSDAYISLLDKAEGGIRAFLRPFTLAVGLQISTLIVGMTLRAIGSDVDSHVEVGLFLLWAFLFIYSLVDVMALTRNVSMHGLTRAKQIERRGDGGDGGDVRSIRRSN